MLQKITLLIFKLSSYLSIGGGSSAPPQRSVYYFADHKEQDESSGESSSDMSPCWKLYQQFGSVCGNDKPFLTKKIRMVTCDQITPLINRRGFTLIWDLDSHGSGFSFKHRSISGKRTEGNMFCVYQNLCRGQSMGHSCIMITDFSRRCNILENNYMFAKAEKGADLCRILILLAC
jgi:hypothetical protein